MFCFRRRLLPVLRNRFQIGCPVLRLRHHNSIESSSTATFRKRKSSQITGVEPVHSGIGNFHDTFFSVSHSTGTESADTPSRVGPRQLGQFCASDAVAEPVTSTNAIATASSYRISPSKREREFLELSLLEFSLIPRLSPLVSDINGSPRTSNYKKPSKMYLSTLVRPMKIAGGINKIPRAIR